MGSSSVLERSQPSTVCFSFSSSVEAISKLTIANHCYAYSCNSGGKAGCLRYHCMVTLCKRELQCNLSTSYSVNIPHNCYLLEKPSLLIDFSTGKGQMLFICRKGDGIWNKKGYLNGRTKGDCFARHQELHILSAPSGRSSQRLPL